MEILDVDLVHVGKVIHVGEEDVDLDDAGQTAACGLEDCTDVLNDPMLEGECEGRSASSASRHVWFAQESSKGETRQGAGISYRVSLDVAVDDFQGLRIHGDVAGAEDKAVGRDDGLGEDGRHGIRRVGGHYRLVRRSGHDAGSMFEAASWAGCQE